jgi:hypothetical protein
MALTRGQRCPRLQTKDSHGYFTLCPEPYGAGDGSASKGRTRILS